MICWIRRLVEFLVRRDRTGTLRRYDWRGRPVDKHTENANFPVSSPQQRRPSTLYPRSISSGSSTSGASDHPSRIS
jgi:hypothetical protein